MKPLILLILSSLAAFAEIYPTNLRPLKANKSVIQNDLDLIQMSAKKKAARTLNFSFNFSPTQTGENRGKILCSGSNVHFEISASPQEQTSTLYYGLQKLGYLFPHPRIQITPDPSNALKMCGESYQWRPAFKYRGFHLHTMHPNEWVHGFLMGEKKMAEDTIRWLARNGQNVVDLNLLKMRRDDIFKLLKKPFALAKSFGIHTGVQLGFAQNQQNSYKLLGVLRTLLGLRTDQKLRSNLEKILGGLDISFAALTAGTSEFTSTNYDDTLRWFEIAADVCEENNIQMFSSIHVSTNQKSKKYGNFNFLPQYASSRVGIWPHTVMFYGLYDEKVPMYGNKNFHHMRNFMNQEKTKRPTWYFPETSYWIGMDVDAPLLLTPYLDARATDMERVHREGVEGHINFTTGHEMGYWLFDWSLTLFNNLDYGFKKDIALELLGEDLEEWRPIINFQQKHFKENQLIQAVSFPNLQDEFAPSHKIHERRTFKELKKNRAALKEEIAKLSAALKEIPSAKRVKNEELRGLLRITFLRIHHAINTRRALLHVKTPGKKARHLALAKHIRGQAQKEINRIRANHDRYPESFTFDRRHNPTAYEHGYAWPASNLHFWKTEEERVRRGRFGPFFRNIYNFIDIIF